MITEGHRQLLSMFYRYVTWVHARKSLEWLLILVNTYVSLLELYIYISRNEILKWFGIQNTLYDNKSRTITIDNYYLCFIDL